MNDIQRSIFVWAFVAVTILLTPPRWAAELVAQSPGLSRQEADDLKIQGEYEGKLIIDGVTEKYGLQVTALGDRRFNAARFKGGLPGAGWNGLDRYQIQAIGQMQRNGFVLFTGDDFGDALIYNGTYQLMDRRGNHAGDLKRIQCSSRMLGRQPPKDAQILFDGTDVDAWNNATMTDDHLLMPGATSNQKFGDHRLHIEFQLPFKPEARGPSRCNSGVFIQGRWEIQILDSLGKETHEDQCGGIYSVKAPDLNMSLPPTKWQTFDIQFKAARYNDRMKVHRPARITVWHNGVKIHNDIELPDKETDGAPFKVGQADGPLCLEESRDAIRFRNIWIVSE